MTEVHEPELVRLFDDYAAAVGATAPGADLAAVRARARRRRRRSAIAVAAVLALAVPIAVYALVGGSIPRSQPGVGPGSALSSTTTPSASPPIGRIEDTDWANVTVAIPANDTGCAAGTARFAAGAAWVADSRYRIGVGYDPETAPIVAYGDVDGGGVAEALLVVSCLTPGGRRNPPSVVLLIGAEPGLRTLGVAFSSSPREPDAEGQNFVTALEVRPDGTVIIGVRTFEGLSQCEYRLQWTGAMFIGTCEP